MEQFWDRAIQYAKLFEPYVPYALAPLGVYGLSRLLPYFVPGPQHQKLLNVKDRTVLITGASTGLGRELAFRFYSHGAKVILTARSIDKLKELCEELKEFGRAKGIENPHEPVFHYLDIAEINGGLDQIVSKAIDGKTIDVLVNNAGLSMRGSCKETPLSVQRQLMEVNYFGHVAVTRALLDSVPDDGAIVVTSSVQGRFAIPYRSAYSASKHALQAFFDSLRSEDRPQLQILVVSAGYMNTGFGRRALKTDGQPIGVDDDNQKQGLSAEDASQKVFEALVSRKTELILAPLSTRFAMFLRWFAPNLLFWLTHKRGKKQLEAQKKKEAESQASGSTDATPSN